MSCGDTWGERVSALLDGELSPEEERDTVRHLSTCQACSTFRDRLVADRSTFLTVLNRAADAASAAPIPIPRGRAVAGAASGAWGRRESWYLAAGLAAGLVVGLVLAYTSRRSPPIDAGRLIAASGQVDVVNSTAVAITVPTGLVAKTSRAVSFGQRVPARVVTGPESAAVVAMADGSMVEIADDTSVSFASVGRLMLHAGIVSAHLPEPRPLTEFVISTSACDFVAVGTAFSVVANQHGYWLILQRGHVVVRRGDRELASRQVQEGSPVAIYSVSPEGRAGEVAYSSALPPEVLTAVERGQAALSRERSGR